MSFNIVQGATKTATAVFTDANGVNHPLASVPVWAVSPAGALTLTPNAAATPSDASFTCTLVGDVVGPVTLTATAEGDPTPGVDTITATIVGAVVAPEDTQGTITVA